MHRCASVVSVCNENEPPAEAHYGIAVQPLVPTAPEPGIYNWNWDNCEQDIITSWPSITAFGLKKDPGIDPCHSYRSVKTRIQMIQNWSFHDVFFIGPYFGIFIFIKNTDASVCVGCIGLQWKWAPSRSTLRSSGPATGPCGPRALRGNRRDSGKQDITTNRQTRHCHESPFKYGNISCHIYRPVKTPVQTTIVASFW